MHYQILGEGFIHEFPRRNGPGAIAVGSRCVALANGDLLCSFMLTSGLGINDFTPVLHRSRDGGSTWSDEGLVWPNLRSRWSIFASISRDHAGNVFLYGSRTPIDEPGESFWSDVTQGLKQNELIWARCVDDGHTWPEPIPLTLPIPGAAEAPGSLCITKSGTWLGPFSPYNTIAASTKVYKNQVVVVRSIDQGRTWASGAMLHFDNTDSSAAEAWCVQLADGRLLGVAWHMHPGGDYPNSYALSRDDGQTWSPTRSTGILGQSTALAACADGRALFIYNQRKHGEIGVWLAVARPTESDFGIEHNAPIWKAETPTQRGTCGEHVDWGDFSFGEPSITTLADGAMLATLWCVQPSGRGIRYLKLEII